MEIGGKYAFRTYRPAAWLKVTGEDAARYLQGQISQDLRPVGLGTGTYGLLLNHKGRIQADAFFFKNAADSFWVGSYECTGETLRARLESCIVADDVVIEDQTADWEGISLLREEADPPPSNTPAAPEIISFLSSAAGAAHCVIFRGRRGGSESWEMVYFAGSADPARLRQALLAAGAREEVSEDFWERARVLAGIPAIPRDAGPSDLPQEVGLVAPSVSFTKGCYVGQEIMARLKTRGRIRRRLRRVRLITSGASPLLPAALYANGKPVGELRSLVSFVGLAIVPADSSVGDRFSLSADGVAAPDGASIELTD